jgi:cyclohexa-1,5-dienecarbonyl-CoA hydratase
VIEVATTQRVVHLTLDAPPVNVLDSALLGELVGHLGRLADDGSLAAVVLSGAGKCFSAGASVAEHRPELAEKMLDGLIDACVALEKLPVPTVAAVHGACLGGGLELAMYCDFVVADPGATFGQPEIRLAFFPPLACARLPRLVGWQNAAFAVLTGETLSAERAAAVGLVQKILPRDAWGELDTMLNGLSAPVLRIAKRALMLGGGPTPREALAGQKELFLKELYRVEDVAEGIASFTERRKPVWKHR